MQDNDQTRGHDPSPVNPLPVPVVVLAMIFFGIELVLQLGAEGLIGGPHAIGWRVELLNQYGFFPEVLQQMIQRGEFPAQHMLRFVSFPFVHISFYHMVFAVALLLAMGKFVGDITGPISVMLVYFLSGAIGVALHTFIPGVDGPVFGGLPGAYGLIGAFTFVKWVSAKFTGQPQLPAFRLIGVLAAIQIIFAITFPGGMDFVADLSAALVGFLIAPLLFPVLRQRILAYFRGR